VGSKESECGNGLKALHVLGGAHRRERAGKVCLESTTAARRVPGEARRQCAVFDWKMRYCPEKKLSTFAYQKGSQLPVESTLGDKYSMLCGSRRKAYHTHNESSGTGI
jgi:hypothetical protein